MKKTLSLILALLLIISTLTGCELDTPATDPTNSGSTAATTPSTAEPPTLPATAPATEPVMKPETEPATEPATEPTTESVTEPVTEPSTEPTTEPTEPPHTHSYTSVVTTPTCENYGYTTYTCACGDEYVADAVKPKGHEYTSEVIAPTCEAWGHTVYTCSCGDSYKTAYTDPHPNRKVMYYGEEEGLQGYYYFIMFECPDCGDIYMVDFGNDPVRRNEELLKYGITADPIEHVHSYTSEVAEEPTCTEWGYITHTCECGYDYIEDLAPTGHDYKTTTVEPTTESEGYDLHECSKCGDSYKDNYTDKLPSAYEDNGNAGSDVCTGKWCKNANCADHPGCVFDLEGQYWSKQECETNGHDWSKKLKEQADSQEEYWLLICKVYGCGAHKTIPYTPNQHVHSIAGSDIIRGEFLYYVAADRVYHCWSPYRTWDKIWEHFDSCDEIMGIREIYETIFPETFVCTSCGEIANTREMRDMGLAPQRPYDGTDPSNVWIYHEVSLPSIPEDYEPYN